MPQVTPSIHPLIVRLREERNLRGLTQVDLGEALGYHSRDISRIETQSRLTRFQALVDYADFLGFDIVLTPKALSR